MRLTLLLSFVVALGGCFFKKNIPPLASEVQSGGSLLLDKCGYTITTQDGASVPAAQVNVLGSDPTPKLIHLTVDKDPARSMGIIWRTNDEDTLATKVQFGLAGATDQVSDGAYFVYDSSIGKIRIHEAHLCGLEPDTAYTYRVGGIGADGTESWSDTAVFRTAPDRAASPDAEIVVLVIGDTRDGYMNWGQGLQQAFAKSQPELILFNGDAVTLGPIQDEWDAWFGQGGTAMRTVPMAYAHGNHDVNSVNFFSQFALPGDEQNYAFDFGPVHIAVANDTPIDASDLTGKNAALLDANIKLGAGAPWQLVMHHKPMWTAAAGPHVSDAETVRAAWQKYIDGNLVDLVLNGHDHDYERTKPMRGATPGATPADGTVYLVVGSAGAALYDAGSMFWTEKSEKTYNFVILKIRRTKLDMTAYRLDGTVLDTMTITKP